MLQRKIRRLSLNTTQMLIINDMNNFKIRAVMKTEDKPKRF